MVARFLSDGTDSRWKLNAGFFPQVLHLIGSQNPVRGSPLADILGINPVRLFNLIRPSSTLGVLVGGSSISRASYMRLDPIGWHPRDR